MSEGHHVEELGQELTVVEVSFHDEDPTGGEERHPRAFQRRVVVVVEVVEPHDAVSAFSKRE